MDRPGRVAVAVVAALVSASALGALMAALLTVAASIVVAEPGEKARIVGLTTSDAMNCAAMFPVFTLPVAIFLAWQRAEAKATIQVVSAAAAGLFAAFGAAVLWARATGHAPAEWSDAPRARAAAGVFDAALYNGALLAMLTVPGASAIAWRARRREKEE